jgi:hypothetical protein
MPTVTSVHSWWGSHYLRNIQRKDTFPVKYNFKHDHINKNGGHATKDMYCVPLRTGNTCTVSMRSRLLPV